MSKLVKEFKKTLIECTEKEIKKGNGNCKFTKEFKDKTQEAIDVFKETFDPMVDTKNDFAFLVFLKLHLDDTMLKLNEFLNWKRYC